MLAAAFAEEFPFTKPAEVSVVAGGKLGDRYVVDSQQGVPGGYRGDDPVTRILDITVANNGLKDSPIAGVHLQVYQTEKMAEKGEVIWSRGLSPRVNYEHMKEQMQKAGLARTSSGGHSAYGPAQELMRRSYNCPDNWKCYVLNADTPEWNLKDLVAKGFISPEVENIVSEFRFMVSPKLLGLGFNQQKREFEAFTRGLAEHHGVGR